MGTPAEAYFETIKTERDLDRLASEQVEDLYVDFKTKSDHSSSEVDRDFQGVLSKAISGFANADGGLVVIGIDARQGKSPQKKPIIPLADFDQNVNSYVPRATAFGVEGIKTKQVLCSAGGGGFLLLLIPPSERAPHRSVKDQRYYQRIGDSFVPMEHYQVADMFGRRHQPRLQPYVRMTGDVDTRGIIRLVLGLKNVGRAIAKYPYISIEETGWFKLSEWGVSGNGDFGLPPFRGASQLREYGGGADHVIYPGIALDVTRLDGLFPIGPEGAGDLASIPLHGHVVADGVALRIWRIELGEAIERSLGSPIAQYLECTLHEP